MLSVALCAIAGCSGNENRRWTEEVQLDDGSSIVVDRKAEYRAWKPKFGGVYSSREVSSVISFTGHLQDLPPWSVPLVPLLLYRDKSSAEWTVVATTNSCEIWTERGRPPSLYWEFRLQDGTWREVPVSPTSFGRKANLFVLYEESLPSRHVSREAREQTHTRDNVGRLFLTILEKHEVTCQ